MSEPFRSWADVSGWQHAENGNEISGWCGSASILHTMDYLATPLRLRASSCAPLRCTGRSNPPSLRASPADELHHFTDLPQLCTARNPYACQMHVRAGHSRGRCTCCNGGEEKRGGGGDGVPGARTWIDCLWPQPCHKLLKNDVELFYFHAHRTKSRATHLAPPRDTAPGVACPSAPSNTRRRQHPIQLRSRADSLACPETCVE